MDKVSDLHAVELDDLHAMQYCCTEAHINSFDATFACCQGQVAAKLQNHKLVSYIYKLLARLKFNRPIYIFLLSLHRLVQCSLRDRIRAVAKGNQGYAPSPPRIY